MLRLEFEFLAGGYNRYLINEYTEEYGIKPIATFYDYSWAMKFMDVMLEEEKEVVTEECIDQN